MGFLRYGSRFWRVTERIFDLLALNLLWLLTSLPLLTVGASCAALAQVVGRWAEGDEPPLARSYFTAFRTNFKTATLLWIVSAAGMAWLIFGLTILVRLASPVLRLSALLQGAVLLLCLPVLPLLFPLCVRLEGSAAELLRSAFLRALRFLPRSVLAFLLLAVPVALTLRVPSLFALMLLFWLFCGLSGIYLARVRLLRPALATSPDQANHKS